MNKIFIILVIFICSFFHLNAQISSGGLPPSYKQNNLKLPEKIPTIILPELDIEKIIEKDKIRNDSALRIGQIIDVNINLIEEGLITEIDDKNAIIRLKIMSKGAKSIELFFDNYFLPPESEFYIYNPDYSNIAGAFTKRNNRVDKKFSTQPIIGDEIILELKLKNDYINEVKMEIDHVSHNYIDIFELLGDSKYTDCFIDVHCNSSVNKNNIRSVMRWNYKEGDGNYRCSCALINQDCDNPNDLKYYIVTANHCGKNAELSTAKFYFNYQRPDCDSGHGWYTSTIGATKKAKRSIYDMFLMELDEKPPEDYNVHFAGWDRETWWALCPFVTGIHHPRGLVKKVSEGHLGANTNSYFWRVMWEDAPTDKGSSGSPLFEDWSNRIIGWDSYGLAGCNLLLTTKYGKLRKAWTGPSSDKSLISWLDPNDNDKIGIDGRDPCFSNVVLDDMSLSSARAFYQPQNNVVIQAGNELSTINKVEVLHNADFTFRAGNKITLNPGFKVNAGGVFKAEIADCQQFKYSQFKSSRISRNIAKTEKSDVLKTNGLIDEELQFKILPNPNNGTFSLRTNNIENEYHIIIYDSFGRVVYQKENIFSEVHEINLLNSKGK